MYDKISHFGAEKNRFYNIGPAWKKFESNQHRKKIVTQRQLFFRGGRRDREAGLPDSQTENPKFG
jgi:hypothetical protein